MLLFSIDFLIGMFKRGIYSVLLGLNLGFGFNFRNFCLNDKGNSLIYLDLLWKFLYLYLVYMLW